MTFKNSVYAAVTALSLLTPWSKASAPGLETRPDVLHMPTLRIQATPPAGAASAPVSKEEQCAQMDEEILQSIHTMLEDFNDEVGTSFAIIAESDYRFVLAPSSEYPHTLKIAIADAYDDRIQATHDLIQHVREKEKCFMTRSSNALAVFNDITLFYDTASREYETNRRNGIMTPEMLYYRQSLPQPLI